MRLTLRTLLAYLDDVLDPADKEQLAQKIESSEFAEDLVHRTRDTVRRLRLSAPQVIGSGMGLDPNTVAEYLDNVLPPESVGDYERICLESDMHLAEAAACHHVLTMVLGEPADVDPIMRQRMYKVPAEVEMRKRVRVEAAHVAIAAAPTAAPVQQVMASPAGVSPAPANGEGLPEYLRTSSWGGLRGVAVALAAVVVVGTGLFLFSGLGGWFGDASQAPGLTADTANGLALNTPKPAEQDAGPAAVDASDQANVVEPAAVPATGTDSTAQAQTAAPVASTDLPESAASVQGENVLIPPQDMAADPPVLRDTAAQQQEAASASPDTGDAQTNVSNVPPEGQQPPATIPTDPIIENAGDAGIAGDPATGLPPIVGDDAATDAVGAESQPVEGEAVADAVPAGPVELGTYLGGKTVLLRYDETGGAWFRIEPRSAVIDGDRLLALPEFRPEITLSSGIHVDVSGGTQVTMRTADASEDGASSAAAGAQPEIEVVYGRVVLINTSGSEQPIRLAFSGSIATARLARNATLAVEVERKYVPGNDPRKSAAPVIARVYAPDGGIVWEDASGAQAINNASRWSVSEGVTSDVTADASPPDWIDHEPVVQLSEQRYGAPMVEGTLVSDKPADIQLLELFQSKDRKEVRSLAAKSSIHVGVFEPFIDALRDSEQKSNWRTHIETLRSAMALSPESAERVWKALVDQRDRQAAADLYEMLCGYNAAQIGRSADQLKSGSMLRLIDWLEEDSLDYRVLAVHNLSEITGKRLMPDPAANIKERTRGVRQWRLRLENGDLKPIGPR